MSKKTAFVAAEEVDDLTYDFTKYVPGAQGTIPEPSNHLVETFQSQMRQVMTPMFELQGKVNAANEDLASLTADVMESLGNEADEQTHQLLDSMASIAADLCQGTPDTETIQKLPFRVQKAFLGWITGVFLSPES